MKTKKVVAIILSFIFIFNSFGNNTYAGGNGMTAVVLAKPTDTQARALVESIFSDGFDKTQIKNIKVNYEGGTNYQIASFSGATGSGANNILEFDSGIALSSGDVKKCLEYSGPSNGSNTVSKVIYGNRKDYIGNKIVNDPCSIEFDLDLSVGHDIVFQYSFGSEEYMKYSNSEFNDSFGIIINGENYAKVPGTDEIIAIRTVNQFKNSEFLRPNINYKKVKSLNLNVPLNGITKTFTASTSLDAGVNHFKIIIGDVGDSSFDSVLFIKSKSFDLHKFEPGILSVEKNADGNVIVKRLDSEGNAVNEGTIGFTLVEEGLKGGKIETAYTIGDGHSEKVFLIAGEDEDDPDKIAHNTKIVSIKNPKMGATLDSDESKLSVQLKIEAPVLSKTGTKKDTVKVKAKAGATVQLYKGGVAFGEAFTMDASGEKEFPNCDADKYYAIQEHSGFVSAKSNTVVVMKAPTITGVAGAFALETIDINASGSPVPYDIAKLAVVATDDTGVDITSDNTKFKILNPLSTDTNVAGVYTIKWTAKDKGFTTAKTKVVQVKPEPPSVFKDNYKDSIINIKGEPNAVAIIKVDGNLFESVNLDGNGDGIILDPPDGDYTATQVVNGVESDKSADDVNINRTFTNPVITLNDDAPSLDLVFSESGNNEYVEKGATVNDVEDDLNPSNMTGSINSILTAKVEIENPMLDGSGNAINIVNPALNADGTAKDANAFEPFVGKYVIKYTVSDSDGMIGKVSRLVRVYPAKPEVAVPDENINAEIEVDAISSASVFLYNENDEAVNIVDGVAVPIPESDLYKDGKHAKLKMKAGSSISELMKDYFTGLPLGNYKVLQRLYGVNSELSQLVEIKHTDKAPTIALNGLATQIMVEGETYDEKGASAKDGFNNPLNVVIDDSLLISDTVGVYKVKYTATDTQNNKSVSVYRNVIVKPENPQVIIGDYVDGVFSENSAGNDIKIIGHADAIAQVVKGSGGNGALYKKVTLDSNGEKVVENLEKTDHIADEFATFQTVSDIQSGKTYFEISKTDTMPVLNIPYEEKVISVEKDGSINVEADIAFANDDEDGLISNKILIYRSLGADGKVSGTGQRSLVLNAPDTNTIGNINLYYSVKDSDGNRNTKIRQVEVVPNPPSISADDQKITVSGLEDRASAEIWFVDEEGNYELFATALNDGTGKAEFDELETGKYVAKQFINFFESDFSSEIGFKNPAYLNAVVIDENGQALKNVELSIEDEGIIKKASTDKTGKALFGVESADKIYEMSFINNGNKLKMKGVSSENLAQIHSDTAIVGALTLDGNPVHFDPNKIVVELKKKVNNVYENTHVAKIEYEDGIYLINEVLANTQYLVDIGYKVEDGSILAVAEFLVSSGAKNTVKVVNHELKYGTVRDEDGNALTGVSISVYAPDRDSKPDYDLGELALDSVPAMNGGNVNGQSTDSEGKYSFALKDATAYVLVASKSGYEDKVVEVLSVDGQFLGENIALTKSSLVSSNANSNSLSTEEVVESEEVDEVAGNGAISYNDPDYKTTDVVEEGEKGDVFVNPVSGKMIYIPDFDAEGEDEFVVESLDEDGNKIKLKKKVRISDVEVKEEDALVMEINSPNNSGFVGDDFEFEVLVKNDKDEKVDSATVAIKMPEGFSAGSDFEYEVKDNYIIILVGEIPMDGVESFKFKLKAGESDGILNELKGLVEAKDDEKISPLSVSSMRMRVYELGKKYTVKPYIQGMPDGKFYKDKPVTRAEVATMLSRCLDNEDTAVRSDEQIDFSDVTDDKWYSEYIKKAVGFGLFKGFSDGTFRPDKNITRAELARVVANYFMINISAKGHAQESFLDIDGHWAEDAIYSLKRYGVSTGYDDGTYKPDKPISREETVKMINKMLGRYEILDVESSFTDTHSEHWSFGEIESAFRGYTFEKKENGEIEFGHLEE